MAAIVVFCGWTLLRAARGAALSVGAVPWAVLIVAAAAVWTMLRPFVIPSPGMADTLLPGDQVLIETAGQRLGRLPRRGDIVAFRYPVDPKQFFIKRVVAVPGDSLHIANKRLYLNGAEVREPWASHKTASIDLYRDYFPSAADVPVFTQGEQMLRHHVRNGQVVVPDGKYFVMGDNRDSSLDSRYWGFITRGDIIGRAVLIYGSYDRATKAETALNTRWSRLLKRLS
ncbi:MAG TPA: signal peptidase I [Bryobacteraceae bacterium]|nr:signal peptidase I [Bryobacteraceae bacterium]